MSIEYPSYVGAMKAAGAEVLAFEEFGSYQGDWWALVEFNGQRGWVHGCYGSCSGCDALQSEFDFFEPECPAHRFALEHEKAGCGACAHEEVLYRERYAEFGRRYLNDLYTTAEALEEASKNLDWDGEAGEMVQFIQQEAA